MRLPVVLAAVAALASTARADQVRERTAPAAVDRDDFWKEVVEPHGDEIAAVSQKIQHALDVVSQLDNQDADPAGNQRARILGEARGMARYLRRLAPANPEVLLLVARVADEAGRTDEALEALMAYMGVVDTPNGEASFRLGRVYLRMRKYDDAIRHLRIAAAAPQAFTTNAVVYLANALTNTGRVDQAIDALRSATERPFGWGDPGISSFALAIAYDRDEQITEAFGVLDRMQTGASGNYAATIQNQIARTHFVPAADEHYFRALLYESIGYLDEARTSWVLYAAAGDEAVFRRRALAHVKAIDTIQERTTVARKHAPKKPVTQPVPPGTAPGGILHKHPPIRRPVPPRTRRQP